MCLVEEWHVICVICSGKSYREAVEGRVHLGARKRREGHTKGQGKSQGGKDVKEQVERGN